MNLIEILSIILSIIGANIALIAWLRNDMKSFEDKIESKINSLEERMFWLSTGKSLAQAILEEKMKKLNPENK